MTIARVALAIVSIFVVLAIAGALFGPPTWDDIGKTCLEETELGGISCACITRELQEAGYEPEDVEGESFDRGALEAASVCVL